MDWGEFFRIDWRKGLIFIVLILLNLIPANSAFINTSRTFGTAYGLPLVFYVSGIEFSRFNYFHLFLDLTILYLFSCMSLFIYDKIKNRKKK